VVHLETNREASESGAQLNLGDAIHWVNATLHIGIRANQIACESRQFFPSPEDQWKLVSVP
jgi:hypothetical protein